MNMKFLPILLLLLGCPPPQPHPPPSANDKTFCDAAQENLLRLQCKDSRDRLFGGPNKSGETYAAVCQNNIENNVAMYAECTSNITDCKGIDTCFKRLDPRRGTYPAPPIPGTARSAPCVSP